MNFKLPLFRYGQPSSSPRGGGRGGGGAGAGMSRGMMPNVSPFGGGRRPSTNASPQIQSPTVSERICECLNILIGDCR